MLALMFTRASPSSMIIQQLVLRIEEFAAIAFLIALLANRIQSYKQNSSGPSNSHTNTIKESSKVSAKVDGTHAAINEAEMHTKTTSDTSTDFSSNGVLSAGVSNPNVIGSNVTIATTPTTPTTPRTPPTITNSGDVETKIIISTKEENQVQKEVEQV